MNTQENTETTDNIENVDATAHENAHETVDAVDTDTVEALPQSERTERRKTRRELSWFAWIAISLIGLSILASILVSLLHHQPRIERVSFSESSTGYCVKEHWKLSTADIKASEAQGVYAVDYFKAKNPNATPDYKTSCN